MKIFVKIQLSTKLCHDNILPSRGYKILHPISGRFAFILTLSYILTSNDGFSCSNINKLIICFAEMPSACKIFNNRPNTIMLASEEHLSSDKNNANIGW
tara:strand:- start:2309 stop:2605 length:297 start_codon:yes stop_codon:yes gene_type:complete